MTSLSIHRRFKFESPNSPIKYKLQVIASLLPEFTIKEKVDLGDLRGSFMD